MNTKSTKKMNDNQRAAGVRRKKNISCTPVHPVVSVVKTIFCVTSVTHSPLLNWEDV